MRDESELLRPAVSGQCPFMVWVVIGVTLDRPDEGGYQETDLEEFVEAVFEDDGTDSLLLPHLTVPAFVPNELLREWIGKISDGRVSLSADLSDGPGRRLLKVSGPDGSEFSLRTSSPKFYAADGCLVA